MDDTATSSTITALLLTGKMHKSACAAVVDEHRMVAANRFWLDHLDQHMHAEGFRQLVEVLLVMDHCKHMNLFVVYSVETAVD